MKRVFIVFVFCVFLVGCSRSASEGQGSSGEEQATSTEVASVSSDKKNLKNSSAEKSAADVAGQFSPFIVYQDKGSRENHFIPSGFMPNGKCVTFDDTWSQDCHEGTTCIKIVYDVACSMEDQKWAGIYWLNPANNWGNRKGGFDLTGATRLTFWAKGDKGGEQIEEIKMGGISGDYPDSDAALIGPVILSNEWKEYSIDLRGKDLSYISGGFSWATNVEVNPGSCIFYIDNIRYE